MLIVVAGVALVGAAWVLFRVLVPLHRLADEARVQAANPAHRIDPEGAAPVRALADRLNEAADRRRGLEANREADAASSRAAVERERQTLAAIVAEVREGVLVCTAAGQVLLYNAAADRLLTAEGGGFLGLGRSVYGLLDARLLRHALDDVEQRVGSTARPVGHFVAARGTRLLRVRVVSLPNGEADDEADGGLLLFVDDITAHAAEARHGALRATFLEELREQLGGLRAAVETVAAHDLDAGLRTRFDHAIHDATLALCDLVEDVEHGRTGAPPHGALDPMLGEDLLRVLRRRTERDLGLSVTLDRRVAGDTWVEVDGYALVQAVVSLVGRVQAATGAEALRFVTDRTDGFVHLDVAWDGPQLPPGALDRWEDEPVTVGGDVEPFSLRGVIERHGAEVWAGRTEAGGHLRLLLPLAEAPESTSSRPASDLGPRPLSFDLDLFAQPPDPDLARLPLAALPCTAFDTETTGLHPSEGDEILSLGAVRIVGGRLRREETFDVLVDPRRPIALSAVAVHGIEPEMVRGQPTIDEVLPRFHRFAEGTALLGHNAAFDLRFLQLKEDRAGVRFDHPVLDTLLLAGVLFPTLQDYSLDGLAAKLGVEVVGRHTALGDALTTAGVYLKLVPLLEAEGITTLAAALDASRRTPLARLSY